MLFKKDSEKKINYKSLNELIELGKIILKVMVVFLVVSGVYAGILLTKELKILTLGSSTLITTNSAIKIDTIKSIMPSCPTSLFPIILYINSIKK